MTRSDEYIATKSKLAALLAERGWDPLSGSGLAIATKPYQTAVGVKEAIAYLVPSNEGGCHFQASYASEGRNVLSTIRAGWKEMTYAEDAAELETRAAEFTAEVDAIVADTYAMRLAASQV